jgi:hypothetical protein
MNGIMYMLLLSLSASLTKQLGMAPGGEFRRAMTEVGHHVGHKNFSSQVQIFLFLIILLFKSEF